MSVTKHEISKTNDAFDQLQSRQSGFEKIRETYPNAYRSWDKEQDEKLQELFSKGLSVADLAKTFNRTRGSIRSRLVKLGLLEK